MDFSGGGGGGDGRPFASRLDDIGAVCVRMGRDGVGGTIAVEPLLVTKFKDGGFASRDKLR